MVRDPVEPTIKADMVPSTTRNRETHIDSVSVMSIRSGPVDRLISTVSQNCCMDAMTVSLLYMSERTRHDHSLLFFKFVSFRLDLFCQCIKQVINNQQGNNPCHHPGARRGRSDTLHAKERVENRADTGKRKPLQCQP